MGRWEPDGRTRLEQAALALYAERGFDATTVAEIAGRAGLTERTFFRHFTDKREVLFGGSAAFVEMFVERVEAAPAGLSPMATIAAAIEDIATRYEGRRAGAAQRQAIIDAHPDLQERELIKLASLVAALAAALRRRGASGTVAILAAETGVAVFKTAFARWISAANASDFPQIVRESMIELKNVTAER